MYIHIKIQWGYIIYVQFYPHSSRVRQMELRNQMQCPSWTEVLPTWLCLDLGHRSMRPLLWMTGDNPTHLWLVSLNPHPATLSLLSRVTLIPTVLLGVSAHPKFVISPPVSPSYSSLRLPQISLVHHFWYTVPNGHWVIRDWHMSAMPTKAPDEHLSTIYFSSSLRNSYSHAESKCPIFFNQLHKVNFTGISFWRWWRTGRTSTLPQTNRKREGVKALALPKQMASLTLTLRR